MVAMDYVIVNPICVETPPWAMATTAYVQSYMLFAICAARWEDGEGRARGISDAGRPWRRGLIPGKNCDRGSACVRALGVWCRVFHVKLAVTIANPGEAAKTGKLHKNRGHMKTTARKGGLGEWKMVLGRRTNKERGFQGGQKS